MTTFSQLNTYSDAKKLLESIAIDKGATSILSNKMKVHYIKISNMHVGAANILKQDALSIGADLAVPRGTIMCEEPYVDALLIATSKQLKLLVHKEKAQPFGLKDLAHFLHNVLGQKKVKEIEIMGVINANDDSFFRQSRFTPKEAIVKIDEMIKHGATIIDIGGVSSRPGAAVVSEQEELQRVKPILDLIKAKKIYNKVRFSIDSYRPSVIMYALQSGFQIVNDITGLQNDEVCKIAAAYKAQVVIMHMQGTPQTMQDNPKYTNILDEINTFFMQRIQKAKSFGIEDIVLDVGVGFGKTLEDNITILKHLESFKMHHKPLLVGASRKSMIDMILPTPVEERLPATLALHLEAARNGASIIRCHDVLEHTQALSIHKAFL